jgi:hypothetical protein
MPTDTSPLVAQIKDLGFAYGAWDGAHYLDLATGTLTPTMANWHASPFAQYHGDTFSELLSIDFFMLFENNANQGSITGGGGTSDQSNIDVRVEDAGNTLVSVSQGVHQLAPTVCTSDGISGSNAWYAEPLSLYYEGGVRTSTLNDTGCLFFAGRVGFRAIGIKA